jgi:dolichol-phosphate mannosyltransferase
MNNKSVVIIPTLNEADNIKELVEEILSKSIADIIVVDDDSTDGTTTILELLKGESKRFDYIIRKKDHGYGKSCIDGFDKAMISNYRLILTLDADFSHPPTEINDLIKGADEADIVICSRYIVGGKIETKWSMIRRLLSKFGNSFAKFMLKIPAYDCTSGYRCYKATALKEIEYQNLKSDGYALLIEILDRAKHKNLSIKEIPFTYIKRKSGRSKLSKKIIIEALFYVLKSFLLNILNKFKILINQKNL